MCTVLFKLKPQPSLSGSVQSATFTDATATGVIQVTQDEINIYQAKAMEDIAAALKQVPGKFRDHVTDYSLGSSVVPNARSIGCANIQFRLICLGPLTTMHLSPPLLSERAKGWNFGMFIALY